MKKAIPEFVVLSEGFILACQYDGDVLDLAKATELASLQTEYYHEPCYVARVIRVAKPSAEPVIEDL